MSSCTLDEEDAMGDDRGRLPAREGHTPNNSTAHDTTQTSNMPPTGLLHLKTRAENRAQTDTIQVWTIELPAKAANNALK